MKRFLDDDFLLDTPVAIDLYEKFARPGRGLHGKLAGPRS